MTHTGMFTPLGLFGYELANLTAAFDRNVRDGED
jgi:hypothetical protein